jgi:hypothetical protein
MISTPWTQAPAGMPAAGLVVRPRALRRAPGAFAAPHSAPCQGTGLPFGASVVDTVVPAGAARTGIDLIAPDTFHTDATTLGIHPSRRPPS